MAFQSSQDAVDLTKSVDASASIDVSAKVTPSFSASEGDVQRENAASQEHRESEGDTYGSKDALVNGVHGEEQSVADKPTSTQITELASTSHGINGIYHSAATTVAANDAVDGATATEIAGDYDTDTSKPDSTDLTKDGTPLHVRSNSVKKPTSFKAVSVTKNFLAKTGATAATAAKGVGEKGSLTGSAPISPQPTAKPRLVAKFGRDSRSSPMGNGASAVAPDASKVWNKNRPNPQPTQRQMTDEELKQHYGIHLATRIQADESGKDSKWADIDDDEDNWAPESVEWIDGTKSILTPDSHAAVADKQKAASAKADLLQDAARTTPSPSPRPAQSLNAATASSAGKTILRPGSLTLSGQSKPGLVLRSVPEAPERPTQTSINTTSKSPWAQLPPVDKVSPIVINPPIQQPNPPSSLRRDSYDVDSAISFPSPAKEMAADDFDRSWKSNERGNRELFNSQSGRYEPVKERRRPSFRNDGGMRQPAVLQRPGAATNGPSDSSTPTPARRRTLSAVSDQNAPSISDAASAGSAHAGPSPTLSSAGLQRYSARSSEDKRAGEGAGGPTEDTVALQERLMRERIELNRRRKREEEEREEAARKERIRVKMESLGPPPAPAVSAATPTPAVEGKSKDASRSGAAVGAGTGAGTTTPAVAEKEVKAPAITSRSPVKISSASSIAEAQSQILARLPNSPSKERATLALANSVAASSVHALQQQQQPPPKKISHADPIPALQTRPTPATTSTTTTTSTASSTIARDINKVLHPLKAKSDDEIPRQLQSDVDRMTDLPNDQPLDLTRHGWKATPSSADVASGWANNSMAAHSNNNRNVWGPPTNDRSLGNGVFGSEFSQFASMQLQHPPPQSSGAQNQQSLPPGHAPGPIAPPSPSPRIPFETARIVSTPSPTYDHQPAGAHHYESSHLNQTRNASASHADRAPPSQSQQQQAQMAQQQIPQSAGAHQRPTPDNAFYRGGPPDLVAAKSAWHNLPAQLAHDEAEAAENSRRERAARLAEEARTGLRQEFQPVYRETYRSVHAGENIGDGRLGAVKGTVHGAGSVDASPAHAYSQQPQASNQSHGPQNARPSRFFGTAVDRQGLLEHYGYHPHHLQYLQQQQIPAADEDGIPPPEEADHPAYLSHSQHPLVKLPMKATVKLPPAPTVTATSPISRSTSVSAAASAGTPLRDSSTAGAGRAQPTSRAGAQPLVAQVAWQDRFNGLFNRNKTPAARSVAPAATEPLKSSTLAVSSASKAPLDVSTHLASATVSLPAGADSSKLSYLHSVFGKFMHTKPGDEVLFDEPEFGSLPITHIPASVLATAHYSTIRASHASPTLHLTAFHVDPTTSHSLLMELLEGSHRTKEPSIVVRVPGRMAASHVPFHKHKSTTADVKPLRKNAPKPRIRDHGTLEAREAGKDKDTTSLSSTTEPRSIDKKGTRIGTRNGTRHASAAGHGVDAAKGNPRHFAPRAVSTPAVKDVGRASAAKDAKADGPPSKPSSRVHSSSHAPSAKSGKTVTIAATPKAAT